MSRVGITILRGERQGLDATMDERFGRAQAFLVVDGETGEVIETIDNPSATAERGAGTGAASLMKSAGIDAVISGRFGPKALDALQALGIETWIAGAAISAEQALTLFRAGGLEQVQS
jgi:predicted Fe-Mo cluster-binding NifX family protein